MSSGIDVLITLPSSGGKFPKTLPYGDGNGLVHFPLEKYQKLMLDSFQAIGLEIVDGFFDKKSVQYPHNLAMLVLGIERSPDFFYGLQDYDVGKVFGQRREVVGSIIVERENTGDFEFNYYNKVFVVKELWGNGLAGRMLRAMNEAKIPGILKTSDPKNNAIYSRYSDVSIKIGPYYFHGFGFVNKRRKEEEFLGARSKFYAAARHIIETKPVTVHPVQNGTGTNNMDLFTANRNLY